MDNSSFKARLLVLHPDFNGGDNSRLTELLALLKERKQYHIENHLCECGCGKLTYSKYKRARPKKFASQMCVMKYRFYRNQLENVKNN